MKDLEVAQVPLAGRGLVVSYNGVYGPGEYSYFTNVIISPEGTIRKRPPVHGLQHLNTTKLNKMVGSWGANALYAAHDEVTRNPLLYASSKRMLLSQITLSNIDAFRTSIVNNAAFGAGTNHLHIEGSFQYGDDIYFILIVSHVSFNSPTVTYRRKIYVIKAIDFSNAEAIDIPASISLDTATFLPFADETVSFNNTSFKATASEPIGGYLIHKERAWVAAGDTVYFSKATALQDFNVASDGGFFRFPGKNIKSIVALGDIVYVIFDDSIRAITYSTSPNTDSRVTVISSGTGGVDAVAYSSLVYVVDRFSIYSISGNNVTKVVDLPLGAFIFGTDYKRSSAYTNMNVAYSMDLKIEAFNDGLYITDRKILFNDASASLYNTRFVANSLDLFRYDLNNDYFSTFEFQQALGSGQRVTNRPADLAVVSYGYGQQFQSRLYFMAVDPDSTHYAAFYLSDYDGFVYGPNEGDGIQFQGLGLDTYSNAEGTDLTLGPIEITIEMKGISPDRLNYLQKKWRSVQVQGNMPMISLVPTTELNPAVVPELYLDIRSQDTGTTTLKRNFLAEDKFSESDPSGIVLGNFGYTYGINQRSSNISFRIFTRVDYTPQLISAMASISGNTNLLTYSLFELSFIQFLYTYVKSRSGNVRNF